MWLCVAVCDLVWLCVAGYGWVFYVVLCSWLGVIVCCLWLGVTVCSMWLLVAVCCVPGVRKAAEVTSEVAAWSPSQGGLQIETVLDQANVENRLFMVLCSSVLFCSVLCSTPHFTSIFCTALYPNNCQSDTLASLAP